MTRLAWPLALIVLSTGSFTASAQTPLRANERYCLLAYDNTGPNPLLCRFETMEQCSASRAGSTDRCMINPEFAYQQQRTNRR